MSASELASAVDARTSCICYFGGDPTPQLPHAIRASKIATHRIKQFARKNGADLVGVAPTERFSSAPPGHPPGDILAEAESVLVCAQHIPVGLQEVPGTFGECKKFKIK